MLNPRLIQAKIKSRNLLFKMKSKLEVGQWFNLEDFKNKCEINYISAERAIELGVQEQHLTPKEKNGVKLYAFH